jgi:Gram-negative bacterial TonB protein C-terminal
LTELHDPVYPKGVQNAAIQGEVELKLQFKDDGTIESVDVVRGPRMLLEAAIESARASHFLCKNCEGTISPYSLTYEFRIVATNPEQYCKGIDEQIPPKLAALLHKVAVFAKEVWTCDPTSTVEPQKVRSIKCLYLWTCGLRDLTPLR